MEHIPHITPVRTFRDLASLLEDTSQAGPTNNSQDYYVNQKLQPKDFTPEDLTKLALGEFAHDRAIALAAHRHLDPAGNKQRTTLYMQTGPMAEDQLHQFIRQQALPQPTSPVTQDTPQPSTPPREH